MIGLLWFVLAILVSPFRSNAQLQAENAALRHQLVVLRRKCRGKIRLTNGDRLSLFSSIAGFPRSGRSFISSARRLSCGGTELGFAATGDGSPGIGEGARRSMRTCER